MHPPLTWARWPQLRDAWPSALAALFTSACCSVSTVPPGGPQALTVAGAFPGAAEFLGDYLPGPAAVVDGIQSTYEGTVVVTTMDRTAVGKVLPAGTRLATPINAALAQHPVIFLIGEQRKPSSVANGIASAIVTAGDYRELILLVPFVVHDTGTRWHNLVVRMYLNDLAAVQLGNLIFGYAKEFARLDRSLLPQGFDYQIDSIIPAATRFVAAVQVVGAYSPWTAPTPAIPRLAEIQRIFEMPLLGRNGSSSFICSYWEWEFSSAEVAPASSQHRFVSEFAAGMGDWVGAGALVSAPDGAVALRALRWRMEWKLPPWKPAACQF